jgi:hypothetical protein
MLSNVVTSVVKKVFPEGTELCPHGLIHMKKRIWIVDSPLGDLV